MQTRDFEISSVAGLMKDPRGKKAVSSKFAPRSPPPTPLCYCDYFLRAPAHKLSPKAHTHEAHGVCAWKRKKCMHVRWVVVVVTSWGVCECVRPQNCLQGIVRHRHVLEERSDLRLAVGVCFLSYSNRRLCVCSTCIRVFASFVTAWLLSPHARTHTHLSLDITESFLWEMDTCVYMLI